MLRQSLVKFTRPALATPTARAFSASVCVMGEGDTGAPRSGLSAPDAFQKREKANEDWAIKQREKEKLLELKKRLADQQAHLQQLSDHIDEITKEQGGEKN